MPHVETEERLTLFRLGLETTGYAMGVVAQNGLR